MGKTVVIFGAGASFDSVADTHAVHENLTARTVNNRRPPLTKDIFAPLYLQKYAPLLRGVSNISSRFLSGGGNLEDYLTSLYQDAKSGKMTKNGQDVIIRSLIETMYYLSVLFLNHTRTHIRTTSNYHALLLELVRRQEDVTFITLNYDSLLERAIGDQGIAFNYMDDYIGQRVQVIKVHGSCDWNYPQRIDSSVTPKMYVNATDGATLINMLDSLDIMKIQKDIAHCSVDSRNKADPDDYRTTFSESYGWFTLPALAIPLNGTEFFAKRFICPPSHVNAMKKALQDAENLLIIGWSGNERHLNELLGECFNTPKKKVRVCNSTSDGCKRTIGVLSEYLKWPSITPMPGGFSALLQRDYVSLTAFLD